MKAWIAGAGALLLAGALVAGPMHGHPRLRAAHNKIKQAIVAMEMAQKANDYDMDGHAAKAEQLMREAEREISLADVAADRHEH